MDRPHRSQSEQTERSAVPSVGRRELMRTGAALATVAGVAGLGAARSDSPAAAGNAGRTDLQAVPDWARWIPTAENAPQSGPNAGLAVFQYDIGAVLRSEEAQEVFNQDSIGDPMKNPLTVGGAAVLTWGIGLAALGLAEPIVGPAVNDEDPDPNDVPADQGLFFPPDGQVYLGSFDESALQAAVDEGAFSETATAGVYVHDEEETVVTWSSDYVVVSASRESVATLVGTYDGDVDRQHEESDDFAWLLRTGGHGGMTVAVFSPDEPLPGESGEGTADYSVFEGARGVAQSVSIDDAGATTDATAAVQYPSEGDVDLERLESTLGTEASDTSITRDGARVTVRSSFTGSVDDETGNTTTTSAETTDTTTESTATPTETPEPTTTAAETTDSSGETTDGEDDGGGDGGDGGGLPGMGVGAALAGLAGGYLLRRRRDGDGES